MKKKNFLTKEQKEFIEKNYHNMQTYKICEELGVTKKQVDSHAWNKRIKKDKDFVPIRKDNSLSFEQIDVIFAKFGTMTNQELADEIGCKTSQIIYIGKKHNLSKQNALLEEVCEIPYKYRSFILENYPTMQTYEISKKTGISSETIRSYAYRHGVRRDREKCDNFSCLKNGLTIEQKKYIIQNYKEESNRDICKKLNLTSDQVKNYASNKGLIKDIEYKHTRPKYFEICLEKTGETDYSIKNYINKKEETKIPEDLLYKSKYGKYHVNQDYFEIINNEWKAYWLGFLYADGNVTDCKRSGKTTNSVSISLCESDVGHLYKFANSIQSEAPIKIRDTNYKDYKCSCLSISNKKIVQDLIKNGCPPKKSLILTFPPEDVVPKDFVRHFIRGYFDGDGCISINKKERTARVNIVGTENFLTTIRDIFVKELNICNCVLYKKENNNAFAIQWGNVYAVEQIFKYLYKDCNIYLDRKLEKFGSVFSLE